jgi:hypothetical protein
MFEVINIKFISWCIGTTNDAEYDPVWRYRQRTVLFFEKVNKARSLGITYYWPWFWFCQNNRAELWVLQKQSCLKV